MRCFIAIELPQEIKARIFHEVEILKDSGLIKGNFVQKEGLHLTIKFLGDTTEEQVKKIKESLKKIKFKPFDITIKDFGFFPSEDHIKVLWLGVYSDKIKDFFKVVHEATPEFKISHEDFSPHLTLARVKSVKNKESLLDKIKHLKKINNAFVVKDFVLMKSELTREGTKYKVLEKFELS